MAITRHEWRRIEKGIFDLEILRIMSSNIQLRRQYGYFTNMAKLIETRSKHQCHKRYENQIIKKKLTFLSYSLEKFQEHSSAKKYFDLIFQQYKARLNKVYEGDEAEVIIRCEQVVSHFSLIMRRIRREEPDLVEDGLKTQGPFEYQKKSSTILLPPKLTAVSNESAENKIKDLNNQEFNRQASLLNVVLSDVSFWLE